jgi:acetyl-CoA carboxylase biotin carboxyl carrier protein
MELDRIKTLIALMNDNGLSELEIEEKGSKVRLVKEAARKAEVVAVPAHVAPVVTESAQAAAAPASKATQEDRYEIVAPMVGTFYEAPSPDADAFVDVGMSVSVDTTVCIIEAMKVMNEIHAEVEGTIVEVLVENGHPVEYGQPLFRVRLEE